MTDGLEYSVGRLTLKPFRQLLDGEAPVAIGRKALELLSVLARAEGALVTKDELMAAVWPKTIVEDNAIQVHIAALRKVLGRDAALLATVRGLGYRLASAPGAPPRPPPKILSPPAPPETRTVAVATLPTRTRIVPMLSATFSLLVVAAVGFWPVRNDLPWGPQPRLSGARLAVLPFEILQPDAASRAFADGLSDKIISELSDNRMQAISRAAGQALRGANAAQVDSIGADMLFDGDIRSDGKTIDVNIHLEEARDHVVVWSDHFRGPADAPEALQADVAAHAAGVAEWAKLGRTEAVKLDATGLAAFIAGRERTIGVRRGSSRVALSDYQAVVAASPNFSWGHSGMAAEDAFAALDEPPSPEKARLLQDARFEARRALALNPHNGEAYLALEMSLPLHEWERRETLLVQGAAVDPSFEPDALMEGRLLWVVGRGRDALPWLQRAHDLDPLHNGATWTLALNLASTDHPTESRAVVRQMETSWPEHSATKDARFWTGLVTNPTPDLALLADPALRPFGMDERSAAAWRTALKANASHYRRVRRDAARSVVAAADAGSLTHGQAMILLAMLGDSDDAFAQARFYEPLDPYAPPYLFLPLAAPLRADSRFIPLAGKLGLVAYWRSTGRWPDFCSEPGLPYDCRRESAKVGVLGPGGG